jgi:hypothetical protein
MKVLSIDLDIIMGSVLEIYQGLRWDDNPTVRWKVLYETSDFKESNFYIDQDALLFCYETFLKALKNCNSVTFGYDHDSILYDIAKYNNIDIVNIDHHDDMFHMSFKDYADGYDALKLEYEMISTANHINEGNWGSWLNSQNKLRSFTWIRNQTSRNVDRIDFIRNLLGDKFQSYLRSEYQFKDYNFDHIFVCLSPQYIPQNHWHYFTMFMMAYEEYTGKKINLIANKKFENEIKFNQVTNEILYKRSNGW